MIKRRDVRFNEKLSEESIEKNEYFEAPLDILEINNKPIKIETSEEIHPKTVDNEDNNEDPDSSPKRERNDNASIKSTSRRAPG